LRLGKGGELLAIKSEVLSVHVLGSRADDLDRSWGCVFSGPDREHAHGELVGTGSSPLMMEDRSGVHSYMHPKCSCSLSLSGVVFVSTIFCRMGRTRIE
jgi:hypothetical protein